MSRLFAIAFLVLCAPAWAAGPYYVRATDGSDSDDGLSVANAFATYQKAADTAAAGELVYLCADGVHVQTATVDHDTNAGTALAFITFRGCAADGTDDGTVATISGSGLGANLSLVNITVNYLRFENLRFTAGTDHNISANGTAGGYIFSNCRIDGATDHGIHLNNSAQKAYLYDCEVDTNGTGMGSTSSSRGHFLVKRCSVHDNTGVGIDSSASASAVGGSTQVVESLIYDNGGDAISEDAGYLTIDHSTIFGNAGDGIQITSNDESIVINNTILRSNGGYGINTGTGDVDQFAQIINLCSHNNTSGHIDINSGNLPGTGHVLEDPAFTSETDGSENLTPTNANLKITFAYPAGGTTYDYIGAIEPNDASAGGGGAVRLINGGLVD